MALGLGEITLDSYLNEPLKAEVDLLNIGGLHEDQIKIRLATTDDFKKMGVDRAYFLTSISFDVEIDDDGRARIVITSEDPVLEPYLDFILEARWPSGRLLREYTVLVDPPVFEQGTQVVSASSRVAEVDGTPDPSKKKREVTETTGTRVDIRDSGLAPGAMPTRAFNASTAPAPESGSRYMIHRDDTLWSIASRARPEGTSVYQTMLDIQRLNPDAFINGNINLIKAGYIIYLPKESDITSGNLSEAVAEVREQNQAWREDRPVDTAARPSLRISAEPEDVGAAQDAAAGAGGVAAGADTMEEADKSGLERAELEQRLASMTQQVETLQRIVSLKDDQIAALQQAIADSDAAGVAVEEGAAEGTMAALQEESAAAETDTAVTPMDESEPDVEVVETEVVVEEPPAAAPVTAPAPAAEVKTPATSESGGLFSNLWLVAAAVVIALLGIFYIRRRGADDDVAEPEAPAAEDAFANVTLQEQAVEVEPEAPVAAEPDEAQIVAAGGHRGYGQRKHDEYASDEDSDALAEAEIYVAYGRFPQAIDLLRNALVNDPANSAYRLKLLQLYVQTGNRSAASEQFAELEAIGDSESIAAGRAALDGGAGSSAADHVAMDDEQLEHELLSEFGDSLESDFSGLAIEEPEAVDNLEDDLDLSVDFDAGESLQDGDDEDLVIAADSNGLSTKLDLARAYMDMGDDDGARQILEEVAAEGNEELQAEARALLERIG
jgi:pilus assembly protein FimV